MFRVRRSKAVHSSGKTYQAPPPPLPRPNVEPNKYANTGTNYAHRVSGNTIGGTITFGTSILSPYTINSNEKIIDEEYKKSAQLMDKKCEVCNNPIIEGTRCLDCFINKKTKPMKDDKPDVLYADVQYGIAPSSASRVITYGTHG